MPVQRAPLRDTKRVGPRHVVDPGMSAGEAGVYIMIVVVILSWCFWCCTAFRPVDTIAETERIVKEERERALRPPQQQRQQLNSQPLYVPQPGGYAPRGYYANYP